MSIIKNASNHEIYPVGPNVVDENTNFVAGDSPHVIDVYGGLNNKLGNRGYIQVDGAGDILVNIAHHSGVYTNQFTVKTRESFDLSGLDIRTIKLTHSGTDSAYRVHVW
ncbi:MAG: hypothetical protein KGL39_43935 [Patescibacteria group bacterium]|nr:hypothetical protein [Patescibacteria group bacterium]